MPTNDTLFEDCIFGYLEGVLQVHILEDNDTKLKIFFLIVDCFAKDSVKEWEDGGEFIRLKLVKSSCRKVLPIIGGYFTVRRRVFVHEHPKEKNVFLLNTSTDNTLRNESNKWN
jgi:hypothetical protein